VCKLRCFYYFLFLFIFSPSYVFSGLLPDNVIYTGQDGCCAVKELKLGDHVVCSNPTPYQLRHTYGSVSGIKLNRGFVSRATLLVLESSKGAISSIMVGSDQKFCIQLDACDYDDESVSVSWIDAAYLQQNMFLFGYNNEKFKVKDIQDVEFPGSIDLYEISVGRSSTFYLLDSNGNRLLTHNVIGIVGVLIIGAVVGAVVGGSLVVYKSYVKKIKVSSSTVLKGCLVGAVSGAALAAVTYYGICLGVKYAPSFVDKIFASSGAAAKTKVALNGVVKSAAVEKKILQALAVLAKLKKTIFIGVVATEAVSHSAKSSYGFIDQKIEDLVVETERREGEDVDFFGADFEYEVDEHVLEQSYQEVPGGAEIFDTEQFFDINGNPIEVVFATYNNL